MERYLIGIDVGTSACKVIAVDGAGRVAAKALAAYPLVSPKPGWAEQDPEHWWEATQTALAQVLDALPDRRAVAGIGLSGQMHGLTALDEADRVLRPAILWCDQRAAPHCDDITARAGGLDGLLALVQNRMLPGFTAGKLLWMREHEPALFARMRRMLNPKDYLRLRLTGEHVTDVSDASGTGLFDVKQRAWSKPLMSLLDLPASLVPQAVESTERAGVVRAELAQRFGLPANTPVFGGGGDSVIQTTSMGVIDTGPLGVTIGTAGIVAGGMRACPEPTGQLQISCGNAPGRWHVMGVTLSAGGTFEWLRGALRRMSPDLSFTAMTAFAKAAEAGSNGLLFLPYLLGERCPHVAADGRAAWIGLTSMHDASHMIRSVMEGVMLNIRAIAALGEMAGLSCDVVRVSGGATSEPFWLHLLADVLQREVTTVTGAAEGGAYGAVLAAGVGAGWWSSLDEAAGSLQMIERVTPDASLGRLYDARFDTFRALYDTLAPLYQRIATENTNR
ncbi:Xylulose kinase [Candidatus Burkholderia verschuerenii]|uniref:Xylulose kinase n=1 Tax=Candidatus Burkholderia verschuerenii TaxID=242163 RepID=A0A0L0ME25_9BURK|nr:xylulokinase [Candidatus Burkholderia verschuerenii]KND60551.1 Xylulose kinase [Candidatus Burkholderia verschuerenii]